LGTGNLVLAGGNLRGTSGQPLITIGNNIIFKADTTIVSGGNALLLSGGVTLAEGDRVLTHNTSATTTFSGVIHDGGQNRGITIAGSGAGSVIFSNTNIYTGATNVNGSTLLVNGTHATGSSYRVASGGTLGGGGNISVAGGGSVTIAGGGTLSVGNGTNSAATLTITTTAGGALTFTDGTSIMRLDITSDASAGSGTDQSADPTRADQLVVSGTVNLNGARLVVGTLGGLDSLTFSEGDRWDLFDWVTSFPVGTFTITPATDLPTLSAGLMWDLSDIYTGGTIAVAVIPEPSRVMLLMSGLMFGLLRRRRRGQ
jgi:autotransporter-associated beta strand protein